jgi:iron-regulated transporter 1
MNHPASSSGSTTTPTLFGDEEKEDPHSSAVVASTSVLLHVRLDERTPLVFPSTAAAVGSNNRGELTTRQKNTAALSRARRLLYVSHFFAQFSEQAWQFSLILFLAAFSNYRSLILVSSYGLIQQLSVVLLGSTAGRFVDGTSRITAARFFVWSENLCVVTATALCYQLLHTMHSVASEEESSTIAEEEDEEAPASRMRRKFAGVPLDPLSICLLLGIHVFGPAAQILDKGFLVAMERDWVVVMGEAAATAAAASTASNQREPDKSWLSDTNVAMRQIDLSCKVVAPAVTGLLIGSRTGRDEQDGYTSHDDLAWAAMVVGLLNVAALVVEYICTARIYALVPALARQKVPALDRSESSHVADEPPPTELRHLSLGSSDHAAHGVRTKRKFGLPRGLKVYLEQPIRWAGIGLSLLYLNALTFGGLMTAYLVWRGMRPEAVGAWRGASSAAGLAGTLAYRASTGGLTLVQTGAWSVLCEWICVSVGFASLFVARYDLSTIMLIAGVCASRVGLWVFDISVTQLMQEFIPGPVRGVVGGTQQSLNAFFQLSSFALGLIFPNPRDFHIYASAGFVAVGLSAIFYTVGVFWRGNDFLTESEKQQQQRRIL